MKSQLKQYAAEHRYLLEVVARHAGFTRPVAVDLDGFYEPLLRAARKGEILPFDGVLVRHWDPGKRRVYPGIQLGMRLYEVEGVRFVRVCIPYDNAKNGWAFNCTVV